MSSNDQLTKSSIPQCVEQLSSLNENHIRATSSILSTAFGRDTYSADSPEYDKSATIRDWQERPEGYKVFASVYGRGYSGVSIIRLPADQEMTVSSSNTKQKTKGGSSVAQLLFIATNCGELRGEGTRLMDHVKSWADAEGYPITPSLNDEDNKPSIDLVKFFHNRGLEHTGLKTFTYPPRSTKYVASQEDCLPCQVLAEDGLYSM